jgi:type IV secretory pathway VirB10-like protein
MDAPNASPAAAPLPPKVDPDSLALRAAPQAVMRLNRRMLIVLAALLTSAVLGAMIWSLQPVQRRSAAPTELFNVERVPRAEKVNQLPKDYSRLQQPDKPQVPVLGPPLPGDLGPAILHAERNAHADASAAYNDPAQAERLARIRDAEEAAKSAVFFRGSAGVGPKTPAATAPGSVVPVAALNGAVPTDTRSGDLPAALNPQDRKEAFLAKGTDSPHRLTATLQLPESPYQVMAGTMIPAALITGINSDLPGQVIASVTEPVYDTATGRHLLIPQGTRLIGRYDSQVAFGQRRVLLVWTRMILPDASSIALDKLPGVDPAGYAGLEDGVDWHWGRIIAGAALSTLLGVSAELASPQGKTDGGQVIVAARGSLQDTVNEVGQEITKRNLNIQPTLTVRPGIPVRVMVSKDLMLRPYQPLFFVRGPIQ